MKNIIYLNYLKTPFGELVIGSMEDSLCICDWRYRKQRGAIDKRIKNGLEANFKIESTPVIEKTILQLQEYFNGHREKFDVDLCLVGTEFQKKVWQALQEIPYGKTMSYLELSEMLGDTKAIRAVATANGANAISIIIPCHRIIGKDGKLVGYAGGLKSKEELLKLEGALKTKQMHLF